jgi:hypothetical protein
MQAARQKMVPAAVPPMAAKEIEAVTCPHEWNQCLSPG